MRHQVTGRILVGIEGEQISEAVAIPLGACVIDPASRIDVETFVREVVPEEILTTLHRAIVDRLGESPGGGEEGGVAPASLPLFESGTTRILSELAKIQRACWSTGGAVRLLTFLNGLQNGSHDFRKWLQSWVYFGRPRDPLVIQCQKSAVEKSLASGPLPVPESGP